jgi:two-component system response regulator GlrR
VADCARLAERNRTEFYRLLQKHELIPSLFRTDDEVVADERQPSTPQNQ